MLGTNDKVGRRQKRETESWRGRGGLVAWHYLGECIIRIFILLYLKLLYGNLTTEVLIRDQLLASRHNELKVGYHVM